ncbi:MAG: radical SAM protein [Desulfurococcaceae archaeon]
MGPVNYVARLLKEKEELREKVKALLSDQESKYAIRDPHATRYPRLCGITVHSGTGCPYQCRYCYIYTMGFSAALKPYLLTGLQLVYALLSNRCFVPGKRGTYLAIGSVTEPFHPITKGKSFEYIEALYKYLGNPVQFSTKSSLSSSEAEKLAELSGGKISPLVTVVTLKAHRELEPYAPPPERRLETLRNLRGAGLQPFLFLRPIIPGITEREYEEIIDLAVEHGAVGVVAGSLRITRDVFNNLKEIGLELGEVSKRLPIRLDKMRPRAQYSVYTGDIKVKIARYARKRGLVFYPYACMANLHAHGLTCVKMKVASRGEVEGIKGPDQAEVRALAKSLGTACRRAWFGQGTIFLEVDRPREEGICLLSEALKSLYLMCVKLIRAKQEY